MASAINPVPDKIIEAYNMVDVGPKEIQTSQGLDAIYDTVATTKSNVKAFAPVINASLSAFGQSDVGITMKEGIDNFYHGMPVLMKALHELKDLHPFVGVAVLAFETVYTLVKKRHENDKKVIMLYVEMKDTVSVLLRLKDVQNEKLIGPDGITIEDHLKSLVKQTAEDIKVCSNVCDTYMKKRPLAKVILSPSWDDKFIGFAKLFTQRRQDFQHELSVHITQGVDKANAKLDAIEDTTKALDQKLNVLKDVLRELASPEHNRLWEDIERKGGIKSVRENDEMLRNLERTASKTSSVSSAKGRPTKLVHEDPNTKVDNLRNDIFEDPDAAAEKNRVVFYRKFEEQKDQIVSRMTAVVNRASDRVVRELSGGPHERIRDKSIHEIWKEMGWRGNVKARHLVLSLRDHFLETLCPENDDIFSKGIAEVSTHNPDAWAIKYVNAAQLQPMTEAIDDDASGFISIAEMNRFTSSRPREWSLPHWVAFWAVGYKTSIIDYANMIERLFGKMDSLYYEVLPPNRGSIMTYFFNVWMFIHALITPVLRLQSEPNDLEKFIPYLKEEETRLGNSLKRVEFIIDGADTLTLITGAGRIEKTIFPLLYLLMKRHYEVMRTMLTKIVDPRELKQGIDSLLCIEEAIRYRVDRLTNNFSQQKLDIKKQFENFAFGIFQYFHDEKALWSGDYVRGLAPLYMPYDNVDEDQNVKPEEILRYECQDKLALDEWVYDGHTIDDVPDYRDVPLPLRDILGHWHGYFYEDNGTHQIAGIDTMMTFVLEPGVSEQGIKANAWSNRGRYTISGSWSKDENDVMSVKLKMSFPEGYWMFPVAYWNPRSFNGRFDPKRQALTGVWGDPSDPENPCGQMEFRRIPPRYLSVYPSIKELSDNKPRALWKFAIAAVQNDIRRERWSWSYFSQRRDDREAVLSMTCRLGNFGELLYEEDTQRLRTALQRLTPADACFYGSKTNHKNAYTTFHWNAYCDSCMRCIIGDRLFCLDCVNKDTEVFNPIDLCSNAQCISQRVTYRQDIEGTHEPTHRLVRVHILVYNYQYGYVHSSASEAYKRVERFCKRIAEVSQESQEKENSQTTGDTNSSSSVPEPALVDSKTVSGNDKPVDGVITPDGAQDGAENTSWTEDAGDTSRGLEVEIPQDATDALPPQSPAVDMPKCANVNCKGPPILSFPCWYCIYCPDGLFICDACETEGVPDPEHSSMKHTKTHHLIRCLAPAKDEDTAPSTEQRLVSIEDRLDSMQSRFDDLNGRFGGFDGRLNDLSHRLDVLCGQFGNIEQLLHGLVGTARS